MKKWIFLISVLLAFNFMINFYSCIPIDPNEYNQVEGWFFLFLGLANLVAFVYAMIKAVE